MKILVTGSAGFIGFNFVNFLLKKKKYKIIGIDNLNNYYDPSIKKKRLAILNKYKNFTFVKLDLKNKTKLDSIFKKNKIDKIIHLAAQAGVRNSIKNPKEYIENNINAFFNVLECVRQFNIDQFFYASSSSVYGESKIFPLKESLNINPKNLYGLTKKNNEEISEIYSKFYNLNICGLRFFTVFGELGRPDMFIMKYLNSILNKKKFYLFNYGNHFRDFTYIEDVNEILFRLINKKVYKHIIFNICSNKPYKITKIIDQINSELKIKNNKIIKIKLQKADVVKTHGSNKKICKFIKFKKFTPMRNAISKLVKWFVSK